MSGESAGHGFITLILPFARYADVGWARCVCGGGVGYWGGGGALSCMQVRAAERTGENEVAEPAKLMGLVECTGPQCGYDALSSEPSDGLR